MATVLPFGLLYVFAGFPVLAMSHGGMWFWSSPLFAFLLMPLLDGIWDYLSPASGEKLAVSSGGKILFELLLHLFVPIQVFILGWAVIELPDLVALYGGLSAEVVGLTLSVGILTGGIGITLAHELVHRREKSSLWGGLLLLSSVLYGHFAVEHVLGHHSHVGTENDGATARRGESLWRFVVRSIWMGVVSAWRIEHQRLKRAARNNGQYANWYRPFLNNRVIQTCGVSALFLLAAYSISGGAGCLFFFCQSIIAIFLLESINYIEHYGLSRKILENGKPEPVQAWHSWDSHSRISSWVLIHLTRHADHHKHPARPFYGLEGSRLSPLLPASYPACVILATVPYVWYRVMHPKLDQLQQTGPS
jgi:alkane 1-monooxygenase